MKEAEIRKYAGLMKELGLTGLEMTVGDSRVRLERSAPAQGTGSVYAVQEPVPAVQSVPENKDYISVKSPIVGVFYAAPAEKAESYVKAGDSVNKGQTLCIIEAMKLMNEIDVDYDCEIESILVSNEQKVEYGQPLFRVRKV